MITCLVDSKEELINDLIQQGKDAFNMSNYFDAIQYFSKVIELDPKNDEVFVLRGIANYSYFAGETDCVFDDFSTAINLNPKNEKAIHYRGIANYKSEKYSESIKDFSQLIKLNPQSQRGFFNRGLAQLRLHLYEKSSKYSSDFIKDLEKAKKLTPKYEYIFFKNNFSLDKFENYIDYLKNNFRDFLIYNHSKSLFLKNRYSKKKTKIFNEIEIYLIIIEKYSQKFESNIYSEDDLFNRAKLKEVSQDYEGAIEDYSKVIILDEEYPDAFLYRGYAKFNLKDYQGAIDDFSKVIEQYDEFDYAHAEKAYIRRGDSKFELKDYQGAIDDFSKVIELYGYTIHKETYIKRGNSKFELKDYQSAIDDFSKVIEFDSEKLQEALKKRSEIYKKISEIDMDKSKDLDDY